MAVVDDFTRKAQGRSCVFVCGSAQMADDVRIAVIEQVNKGGNVELFEEMYGW